MNLRSPTAVIAVWASGAAVLALIAADLIFGTGAVRELVVPLTVASALSIVAIALSARWLSGATLRARFVGTSVLPTAIGLANLAVLTGLMMVSSTDAEIVAVLLVYATGTGIGAGMAAGRSTAVAVSRISETAHRIAGGDLNARAGGAGGGRELDRLARALDDMAAELDGAQRRERRIEAQRRDLIVAVSHDLRTPLADLRAMAEAIEDRVVTDPVTVGDYAGRMSASVTSLSRLVDDLFEFVQLEPGAIEAESQRARVGDVVDWALDACTCQAQLKHLQLRTELGEAAGATCSPRLTRVLQNLLANAIRHTPDDGTVVVLASCDGAGIELAVEDTGSGIQPEVVDRVFEPFWRGDEARAESGAGLGLALAKRIVESMGGTIAVESTPALGSRFAVRIPASA